MSAGSRSEVCPSAAAAGRFSSPYLKSPRACGSNQVGRRSDHKIGIRSGDSRAQRSRSKSVPAVNERLLDGRIKFLCFGVFSLREAQRAGARIPAAGAGQFAGEIGLQRRRAAIVKLPPPLSPTLMVRLSTMVLRLVTADAADKTGHTGDAISIRARAHYRVAALAGRGAHAGTAPAGYALISRDDSSAKMRRTNSPAKTRRRSP